MKKNILYCISATIILLASCAKIEVTSSDETAFYKFNPSIDIINLPLNRYFIYKDSATGVTEFVRVTESIIEKKLDEGYFDWDKDFYYETYKLTLTKIAGSSQENWFSGFAQSYVFTGFYGSTIDNTGFKFYEQGSVLPVFWCPFTSSGNWQYTQIPSLTVNGTVYTGVHKFISTNGKQPSEAGYLQLTCYWVKGIGIIKREIRTDTTVKTFLLVSYG